MNWTDFIVFLEKQWERKSTLAILLIVVFVGLVAFFTKFELLKLATWQWGIILLFLVVLFFTWRMTTKIPNAKKGKAGILIAIIPENDNDKNTIESDFIQIMRDNAVSDGNLQIISVPLPLAKKIVDQEAATNFCKKSNAKMLLWGYVKKRKISDIECRVLRLHSTIIHPPIPGEFSAILAHNMGQLMPLNINVDCNNEYLCFEVTAKWMHLAAKFFVTQIISLEGNIELAEKTYLICGGVSISPIIFLNLKS